jgi:hypothetical protein
MSLNSATVPEIELGKVSVTVPLVMLVITGAVLNVLMPVNDSASCNVARVETIVEFGMLMSPSLVE